MIKAAVKVAQDWEGQSSVFKREWLKGFLLKVVVSPTVLTLHVNPGMLHSTVGLPSVPAPAESIALESKYQFKWDGRGLRFVIPRPNGDGRDAHVDKPLIQAVARGRYWYDLLLSGQAKSREEIAKAYGISGQHVARLLPLAWLAPDIVEAILDGRQPKALTVKRLLAKLPMDWADQRRALGFEPKTLIS